MACFLRKELHACDAAVFSRIANFCKNVKADGEKDVAALFTEILNEADESFALKRKFLLPSKIPAFKLAPEPTPLSFHCFMAFEEDQVAQQIARLDWKYYTQIDPR